MRRLVPLLVTVLAIAVGCSDDGGDDAATTSAGDGSSADGTTTTVDDGSGEDTTTTADDGSTGVTFPETPLQAVLETTYPTGDFDVETFGVEPGTVTAAWYTSGDRWAVHYEGITRETASGKCPGNSIQTDAGFEHISNSPFGALACNGYEESATYQGTILPPGSLFACEDAVVYVTEIPLSAEGALFGSLEQVRDDGVIQGMTSAVEADTEGVPEIDVSNCTVIS
jgi:hypothetical protein